MWYTSSHNVNICLKFFNAYVGDLSYGTGIFVNFGSNVVIYCIWVVYWEELVMETFAGIVRIWDSRIFVECCKWAVNIRKNLS